VSTAKFSAGPQIKKFTTWTAPSAKPRKAARADRAEETETKFSEKFGKAMDNKIGRKMS
jgi:hypothetical protein